MLGGNPGVGARNLQELIAYAKTNPGRLNYASTGVGRQLHIGMEMFKLLTNTDIVHVPYRATTSAMADLLGGRIDLALLGLSSVKASGRERKAARLRDCGTAARIADAGHCHGGRSRAAGLRGAVVVRYARAGKGAAKRHRPSGAGDQKGLGRSEVRGGVGAAGHAGPRLVPRRDGASDA